MNTPKNRNGVILDFAHEIILRPISWLWDFWIAAGKVHLLVGDPGSGKTTLLADLLAAFSTGGLLPDGTHAPKAACIYWSGEDGIEDTVGVRLKAAGANLRNVLVLRGVSEHGRKRFFKPSDIPTLVEEIKRLRAQGIDVRVIAIDPLPGGTGNSNSNDDVRRTLEPLIVLAEEEGLAIIGVRHLSKGSGKKKLADRINGSVAYLAISRIVMFASKIAGTGTAPDNPPRSVLVRAKSNIGPTDGGFAFTVLPARIEVDCGMAGSAVLKWDSNVLDGDPESIVRVAESNAGVSVDHDLASAIQFLGDTLYQGPRHSSEVLALGKEQGFIPEKLRQALAELGGKSGKEPGMPRGPWYWWLPGAGFDGRRDRSYGDRRLNRHDEAGDNYRRTDFRRPSDTQNYDDLRTHHRDKGRFNEGYDEKTSKDEQVEKDEKSVNMEHENAPRWLHLINLPGDDEPDLPDEPVGV